jgi:hypothetical protein
MQTSNGSGPTPGTSSTGSSDGGVVAPVVISDVTSGAAYKHADGFDEVYGDYGEIAITSAGKTIATWGEGLSWVGPGGVWFNRQN